MVKNKKHQLRIILLILQLMFLNMNWLIALWIYNIY